MREDEYCGRHDRWFGTLPCPGCVRDRDAISERDNAEYTRYVEGFLNTRNALSFYEWRVTRAISETRARWEQEQQEGAPF